MAQSTLPNGSEPADEADRRHSEVVLALHLAALRRQFDAIRTIYGDDPPHRSREALWVALEVLLADLRGERIALRDLVARAGKLVSAPTLSRVVAELEQQGLLRSEAAGRLKLLQPTARAREIMAARADEAFATLTGILAASLPDAGTAPEP